MSERWESIHEYPGYEISDLGRVRSCARVDAIGRSIVGRVIGAYQTRKGYLRVRLWRDGHAHQEYVAHLVLTAFVSVRPVGLEAAHCNGNKQDNVLLNLRWATPTGNRADRLIHGTWMLRFLPADKERAFDLRRSGAIQREIASWLGMSQQYVSELLRNSKLTVVEV